MSKNTVYFKQTPITVTGNWLTVGQVASNFTLTDQKLHEVTLNDFSGKRKILSIFPSLDTATCALSVRHFNQIANQINNCVVLCISADLPFAQQRFCVAEGLNNVITLSTFRHSEFLKQYGVAIQDGSMVGLAARAVIVLDEHNRVLSSELVTQIGEEPDYEAALAVLK